MLRVYILLYNILHNYLYVRRDSTELNVRCMLECTMYCTIYKSNKKKSDTISSSRGVSRDSAYLYVRHDSRSHSGMHLMSSLIQYVFIRIVDINTIRIYTYCRHTYNTYLYVLSTSVSHMNESCLSYDVFRHQVHVAYDNTYKYVLYLCIVTGMTHMRHDSRKLNIRVWGMTHVS